MNAKPQRKADEQPTALGAALQAKGFVRRNVAMQIAIAAFQNDGGEYGVLLAMVNAAYGRVGQANGAREGHALVADAQGDGPGHQAGADKANQPVPGPHSHAKRGRSAIDAVQPTIAKSLFDSIVLPDGRRLREVRWSECPALASRYQFLSRVLLACRNYAIPVDPSTTLDDVVPENELALIVSTMERINATV